MPASRSSEKFKRKRNYRTRNSRAPKSVPKPSSIANELPATHFSDLPLSQFTKKSLASNGFMDKALTPIQASTIPPMMAGKDVLGVAETGSGKTLAFVIPIVERLRSMSWQRMDGLGAIILSPTRELAEQLFKVLRSVAYTHSQLTAGLVTGGKSVEAEQRVISSLNILIATPGRLAEHCTSTDWRADNIQMLVLDEADKLLEMGFRPQLQTILDFFPQTHRQTALFTATMGDSIDSLAALSLKDPHRAVLAGHAASVRHIVMNVPLQDKLDLIWGFVRSHLHTKTIVFLATGRQVRFVFEAFRQLRPGVSVYRLCGTMKMSHRQDETYRFRRTKHAVLFATDIAARGLDFPDVKWVLQGDCPPDSATYLHRAGRAGRMGRSGVSLLLLTPQEQGFMPRMAARGIEPVVKEVRRGEPVRNKLATLCASNDHVRHICEKALAAYAKSVHVAHDKAVFPAAKDLPLMETAQAWGLSNVPIVGTGAKSTTSGAADALSAALDGASGSFLEVARVHDAALTPQEAARVRELEAAKDARKRRRERLRRIDDSGRNKSRTRPGHVVFEDSDEEKEKVPAEAEKADPPVAPADDRLIRGVIASGNREEREEHRKTLRLRQKGIGEEEEEGSSSSDYSYSEEFSEVVAAPPRKRVARGGDVPASASGASSLEALALAMLQKK
eukprot:gnl/Dysnectes_brevis/1923_a2208_1201.p1 GENE.gnl/Dysnectes_brevis/1923_a2208_1201~~gnl/Dysnectes_brevis/1923_a2208_1201.p1  ORF type:complete len:674 (+),score=213.25 gnl/Dysnectes_brevis/1923_a2208_1201:58-2079(+)